MPSKLGVLSFDQAVYDYFSEFGGEAVNDRPTELWAWWEPLRIMPGIQSFETSGGLIRMNSDYIREEIRSHYRLGVKVIIIGYVEYLGYWVYQPSFAFPYDWDTSTSGVFWTDAVLPENVPVGFDLLQVVLDECSSLGMRVYVGTGRNGDTHLLGDIYAVNVAGDPDPNRYGITLLNRTAAAVARSQQLAADIVDQFGSYSALAGWYISHELSHLGAANNFLTWVNYTGYGGYPTLRSHGLPIMVSPGITFDVSATSVFGVLMDDSGCDIFIPQQPTGAGGTWTLSPATTSYTYDYNNTLPLLFDYIDTWRQAGRFAKILRPEIQVMTNVEIWTMDGPSYANAYPDDWPVSKEVMLRTAQLGEAITIYSTFGTACDPANSLQPAQSYSGIVDYRDRAAALWSGLETMFADGAFLRAR